MALPNELLFELKDELELREALILSVISNFVLEKRSILWKEGLFELIDYFSNCIFEQVPVKYMLVTAQHNQVLSVYLENFREVPDSIIVPEGVKEIKIPDSVQKFKVLGTLGIIDITLYKGCILFHSDYRFVSDCCFLGGSYQESKSNSLAWDKFMKIFRGIPYFSTDKKLHWSANYDSISSLYYFTKIIDEELYANITSIYFMTDLYSKIYFSSRVVISNLNLDKLKRFIRIIWPLDTENLHIILDHCPKLEEVGYTNPDDALIIAQKGIKGFRFYEKTESENHGLTGTVGSYHIPEGNELRTINPNTLGPITIDVSEWSFRNNLEL